MKDKKKHEQYKKCKELLNKFTLTIGGWENLRAALYYSNFTKLVCICESRGQGASGGGGGGGGNALTDAGVVIDHAENAVAAALHVVVGADAAEHGRQAQLGPCTVARVSADTRYTSRPFIIHARVQFIQFIH